MRVSWDDLIKDDPIKKKKDYSNPNDSRSRFKQDFDTICFSSSFRRLQDKVQVFPIEEGDFSRTRLTHSIEVMTIAQSLGEMIVKLIRKKEQELDKIEGKIDSIPIILMASSLIHDLGNPPFGHITEDVIRRWFKNNLCRIYYNSGNKQFFYSDSVLNSNSGCYSIQSLLFPYEKDFVEFDSNAQSIRIITRLQNSSSSSFSMNLSYTVIATIIKYPYDHQKNNYWKQGKYGVFACSSKLYQKINKKLKLGYKRHPLTFLLEAADDIAYLSTDIEDAFKKGLVTLEDFINRIYKTWEQNGKVDENYKKILEMCYLSYKKIVNKKLDAELINVIKEVKTYDKEEKSIILRRIIMYLKGIMIDYAYKTFESEYDNIMELKFNESLLNTKCIWYKLLREIEEEYIYYGKDIIKNKIVSEKIISKILDEYVINTLNFEKDNQKDVKEYLLPNLISSNYHKLFEVSKNCKCKDFCFLPNGISKEKVYEIYKKLHMVLDEITGMTDSYAVKIYELLK